jgi:hypothetical protein
VPVWSARADGATRLGTDHSSRALLVGGLHINPRSERPAACPGLGPRTSHRDELSETDDPFRAENRLPDRHQ